jgi:hypothetical protein
LPIYGDMAAELELAISSGYGKCPLLIQREGKPVFDFEKSWKTACEAAGIEETIFHDLGRTAITNMIEAGYSEKDAVEISGHKTRAVFDRYNIVSSKRIRSLATKMEEYLRAKDAQIEPAPVQDAGARQIKETRQNVENNGEPGGDRTRDNRIKSAVWLHPGSPLCIVFNNLPANLCMGLHVVRALWAKTRAKTAFCALAVSGCLGRAHCPCPLRF